MSRKKQLSLSCLTLLCSSTINAGLTEGFGIDFEVSTGNTLPEQTYLDNYPEDEGKHALLGVHSDSRYVLINRPMFAQTASLHTAYYPAIKTTVSSADMILRLKRGEQQYGMYGGFDYTQYDDLTFKQFVFGIELSPYETFTTISFFVPFGDSQSYKNLDPVNGATLVDMHGAQLNAVKRLQGFDIIFQSEAYRHSDTRRSFLGLGLGAQYDFGYMTLGSLGQYRNGIDSETYAFRAYGKIPLLNNKASQTQITHKDQNIMRLRGAVLNAEEKDCGSSGKSYSIHGVTTCQDSNPFDSAMLNTKNAARQLSELEYINSQVEYLEGGDNAEFVYGPGLHQIKKPKYLDGNLTIKPGAMLCFDRQGAIITKPDADVTIGQTGDDKEFVIMASSNYCKSLLTKSAHPRLQAGYHRSFGADSSTSISPKLSDGITPLVGVIVTGKGRLDLDNGVLNSTNFANLAEMVEISKQSASTTNANAQIRTNKNIDGGIIPSYETIGGHSTTNNRISQFNKTLIFGVPVRGIATNMEMDEVQILSFNQPAVKMTGGKLNAMNSVFMASENTPTLIDIKAGTQATMYDSIFDLSQGSSSTTAAKVRHFGRATDVDSMTTFQAVYSYFKGAKGTDTSSGTSSFIDITNLNRSSGNGIALGLVNSTIHNRVSPATKSDVSSSNISSIFSLKTDTNYFNSNAESAATLEKSVLFAGNTILVEVDQYNINTNDKKGDFMFQAAGLGKVFKHNAGSAFANGSDPFHRGGGTGPLSKILASALGDNDWGNGKATSSQNWYESSDTFAFLRQVKASTLSSRVGPTTNDALTLPTGTNSGTVRAQLANTAKFDFMSGSKSIAARTGGTSNAVPFGATSNAQIAKMRDTSHLFDLNVIDYLSNYLQGKATDQDKNYTKAARTSTSGTAHDTSKF